MPESATPPRPPRVVLFVGVLLFAGITVWGLTRSDRMDVPSTELANTTVVPPTTPATTTPATTLAPAISSTTVEDAQEAAASTTVSEAEKTTEPAGPVIAQQGPDIVRVDPTTGETEVARSNVFEASWADNLAFGGDRTRLYYHLIVEDYWFSCESAQGEVRTLDLETGGSQIIDEGRPALSPGGQVLAYLTAEDCHPDPEQPEFFVMAYDTLVVADPDGNERARLPLESGDDLGTLLVDLAWIDPATLLIEDLEGNYHRIPVDEEIGQPEQVDLAGLHIHTVVNDHALGTERVPPPDIGSLVSMHLSTGEMQNIDIDATGPYGVGVSEGGRVVVAARDAGGEGLLLVDVDAEAGTVDHVVGTPRSTASTGRDRFARGFRDPADDLVHSGSGGASMRPPRPIRPHDGQRCPPGPSSDELPPATAVNPPGRSLHHGVETPRTAPMRSTASSTVVRLVSTTSSASVGAS